MSGIAEVETAILARLQAAGAAGVLGYRYRTLATYPEDFDAHLKERLIGQAFPAAWVVFGGWGRPVEEASGVQVPAVFMLVVAAENLRNEQAQRHGGAAGEVGSYQLLMDAAALLQGQRLGLDMAALEFGPCRSVRPTEAIRQRKLSVFALELTTVLPISASAFPAPALDDFETFHADWDVRPFGGIDANPALPGVQLPAPATGPGRADAVDRVELQP